MHAVNSNKVPLKSSANDKEGKNPCAGKIVKSTQLSMFTNLLSILYPILIFNRIFLESRGDVGRSVRNRTLTTYL